MQNTFSSEQELLNHIESVLINENIEKNELLVEFSFFAKEYKRLVKQLNKLIKISDSTQRKLFDTKETLKEQNAIISTQNENLQELNAEKDKYLSIINHELLYAAKYVLSLIPPTLKSEIFHINWKFVPSTHLGGDAFGYHWIDEENFAIYLFDVSGHGVGPALHSVSIINLLRHQNLNGVDFKVPEQVFTELNHIFQMSDHEDLCFTMWYGVYNLQTRELKYAGAGHPPALVFSPEKELIRLKSDNFMIGVLPEFPFQSKTIPLPINSIIYLYSDGVYEILKQDGNMMTLEELIDFLDNNNEDSGSEIDKLYTHLQQLQRNDKLEDDFSIMKVWIR